MNEIEIKKAVKEGYIKIAKSNSSCCSSNSCCDGTSMSKDIGKRLDIKKKT